MKIKKTYKSILTYKEYIYDVFAIYWDRERTYFLYLDPEDDYALHVYSSEEVKIIDYTIGFNSIFFKGSYGMHGIYHWALIEKKLLDDVIDGDESKKKEFVTILREENLI